MGGNGKGAPRRRKGGWDPEPGRQFLALLAETGNAREAARRLGRPNTFHNRRRRDPEFRAKWDAIVAEVDGRLKGARSAFPERKAAGEAGTFTSDCPGLRARSAEELGGMLQPGRKRPQTRPEPVIRRTSNGRLQVSFAREGHMTSEIEADFLERLAATGNFNRSALAVGFEPASVKQRMTKWPAFREACTKALDEATAMLDFRLVQHAHALLRTGEEVRAERDEMEAAGAGGGEEIPFDPAMAMRILGFIERRRAGHTGFGRRRNAPSERSFDDAIASVLAKIEAIERHEAMMKARRAQQGAGEGDGQEQRGGGIEPAPH